LTVFTHDKESAIRSNQNLIANTLQNWDERDAILLTFSDEKGLKHFEELVGAIQTSTLEGDELVTETTEFLVPNELNYFVGQLNLLEACTMNRNSRTQTFCINLINVDLCLELYTRSKLCWPIKDALLRYIRSCYLESDFNINLISDEKLTALLRYIFMDIETLATEKRDIELSKAKFYVVTTGYEYIGVFSDFCMMTAMEFLRSILQRKLEVFLRNVPLLESAFKALISLRECLEGGEIRNKSVTDTVVAFRAQPSVCAIVDQDLLDQLASVKQHRPSYLALNSHALSDSPRESDPAEYLATDIDSKSFKLKSTWASIEKSESLRASTETDFERLGEAVVNIEKRTEKAFGGKATIKFKEIVTSLLNLLEVNEVNLEGELSTVVIKLMRKMIEMENHDVSTPASEWEPDEWTHFKIRIENMQNILSELGSVRIICMLLADCRDIDSFEELILWANALLLGGNNTVQEAFLEHMENDDENSMVSRLKSFFKKYFTKFISSHNEINKQVAMLRSTNLRQGDVHSETMALGGLLLQKGYAVTAMQDNMRNDVTNDYGRFNRRLLRFFQLLCEGHNQALQDFLREQTNENSVQKKSFDLVGQTAGALSQYVKVINSMNTEVGLQILETLIEFLQGPCRQNQEVLCMHTKIIDNVKDIISSFKSPGELQVRGFSVEMAHNESIHALKRGSAKLLVSLTEGEPNIPILGKISGTLDLDTVRERMEEVFQIFFLVQYGIEAQKMKLPELNQLLSKENMEGDLLEGFDLFSLMNVLSDDCPGSSGILTEEFFTPEQLKAYQFFKANAGRIEAVVKGKLERVYFPINPVCNLLSMKTRLSFMYDTRRDSPQTKINDMMQAVPALIDEMYHNERLSHFKFQVTTSRLEFLQHISTTIAFTINILMLLYFDRTGSEGAPELAEVPKIAISYLGYCQLLMSTLLFSFWIVTKAELHLKKTWRDFTKTYSAELPESFVKRMHEIELSRIPVNELTMVELRDILYSRGPYCDIFYSSDGKRSLGSWPLRFEYWLITIQMLTENLTFRYYVFYIAISALGKYFTEIFYTFHLLDIVTRNSTLQNVIRAVTVNYKQLVWTGFLCLIIIYIYSVFGFFFFAEHYLDKTIQSPSKEELGILGENLCQSLFQCFFSTLNLGLRNGGGIADVLSAISYEEKDTYYGRILFDLTFYIIVIVIFLNIIFGIIIDTFAQLRDEKMSIEEDLQSNCFVCHIDRYTFDRNGAGFEYHIFKDHNVWHYIYYLVHLLRKDETEYTGVESYVRQCYDIGENSWIPQHRAIVLDGNGEKEDFEETMMKMVPEIYAKIMETPENTK